MKRIEFTKLLNLTVKLDGTPVDTDRAKDLDAIARANKLAILDAVLVIENTLGTIVSHYFFADSTAKKMAFEEWVIGSDWCSYSSKRKLVNEIIRDTKILDGYVGLEIGEFDRLLGKAMRYRNAFTHGVFSTDADRVWLSYFEGVSRKDELTDAYLDKIRTEIFGVMVQAFQLAQLLGGQPISFRT